MKTNLHILLLTVCVLALVVLCFLSVYSPMRFDEQRTEREMVVRQRLQKIRNAEETYRARHGEYAADFAQLVAERLIADSITVIPFSGGRRFVLSTTTQLSKSGKALPLMECSATYADYLSGLDENAIAEITEKANAAALFPGLKIGDLESPNGNAGNWE